jgi:hypothetical protein
MNFGLSSASRPTKSSTGISCCALSGSQEAERLDDHRAGMVDQNQGGGTRRIDAYAPVVKMGTPLVVGGVRIRKHNGDFGVSCSDRD